MKRKPTSYNRFYALLARTSGDRDITKEALVERFTKGRTTSLREMNAEEYDAMCRALAAELDHPGMSEEEFRIEMRRLRSGVLHRLQRMGIDTTDWEAVDAFCLQPRIAGKRFCALSPDDLRALTRRLEALAGKGYVRKAETPGHTILVAVPANQRPS